MSEMGRIEVASSVLLRVWARGIVPLELDLVMEGCDGAWGVQAEEFDLFR